ncbi:MAG: rRNA maturation RNase YbeY [Oscillospiraceae bacterium]|nr:rRNA maturation RNase YbeY [Oscillospiraceae bacterium]
MRNEIYVSREVKGLGFRNAAALIKKAVNRALDAEKIDAPCIVSVLLTDDEGIREMNRQFRDTDRSTDVLSFPLNELQPGDFDADICEKDPGTGSVMLGDILINIPQCAVQGEEFGHGFDRELTYLTVHSVLHLLGYDHTDEGEMKKQMRRREKEIMGDE